MFPFLSFINELLNAKDVASTPFKTPVTVDDMVNDKYPDSNTLTITEATQGLHGTCMITGNNQIMYTPELGYSGPEICPYLV